MRRKTLIVLLILVAAASVTAAWFIIHPAALPPSSDDGEKKLVADVNGRPVTAEMFRRKYSLFTQRFQLSATEPAEQVGELKMSFLNKLIETELLLQEAELRGIQVTDEELDHEINQLKEDYPKDTLEEALVRIGIKLEEWREERREKLLIDKLIKREVDSVIHVSEQDISQYYKEHLDEFKQPVMVRARQIVVATEEEAGNLRTRLLKGEDFAELARQYSLSPDAGNGGDLGYFAQGQMPEEFDEAVFRFRVGSITSVVQSPYGFHIFKVEDRLSPRTLSLEEVHDDVAGRIFQARQETFFNEWLNSLREQARITVYPENLDGAGQ